MKIEISDFTITNHSSKLETEKLRREKLSWIQEKTAIEKNLTQKNLELNNRIFHISQLEQELKEERNINEDLKQQLSEEKQSREKAENELQSSAEKIKHLKLEKLSFKISSLPETTCCYNPRPKKKPELDFRSHPRGGAVDIPQVYFCDRR